jgi:hypothetical protein
VPITVRTGRNGILLVVNGATVTVADWQAMLRDLNALTTEIGVQRILIDAREQVNVNGTLDIYYLGWSLPSIFRVAIVPSDITREAYRFLETLCRNRGKQVEVFMLFGDAVGLLLRSS